MWTLQDKEDYVAYLRRDLREENKKPKTIAKMVNLNNITADLNSIDLTH